MGFLDRLLGREKHEPDPKVVVNHEEQAAPSPRPSGANAAPADAKPDVDTI